MTTVSVAAAAELSNYAMRLGAAPRIADAAHVFTHELSAVPNAAAKQFADIAGHSAAYDAWKALRGTVMATLHHADTPSRVSSAGADAAQAALADLKELDMRMGRLERSRDSLASFTQPAADAGAVASRITAATTQLGRESRFLTLLGE